MNKQTQFENRSTCTIVVLGYKNKPDGTLHPISQQRANQAFELAQRLIAQEQTVKLLCTGGFGGNFNQSNIAHGQLVQNFLCDLGLSQQQFLPFANSKNTYEDGRFCAERIELITIKKLILVTSDFHIKRGFLWLHHFCPNVNIICKPAKTMIKEQELAKLIAHEKRAINRFYQDFPDTQTLEQLYDWNSLHLPF